MKMTALKPRDSRIAAIVLLLLALLLAYFVLLHWWFVAPLQQIRSDMADLRDTHSRYAAAIAEKPSPRSVRARPPAARSWPRMIRTPPRPI